MERTPTDRLRRIGHRRWLLPVLALALAIALSGFPFGIVRDGDDTELFRGNNDGSLPTAESPTTSVPTAAIPTPTATARHERALLDIAVPSVTPERLAPTATRQQPTPTSEPEREPEPIMLTEGTRERSRERALLLYTALWEQFYLPDELQFRETAPHQHWHPYAFLWPLTQTLGAANDMASLPGGDPQHLFDVLAITTTVEQYYDDNRLPPAYSSYIPPPNGPENDRFYDDNAWLGLELLRAYEITGYETTRERASLIFDYLVSGWDEDPANSATGGVAWVEANWNSDRNTVSTAPSAKLGLLLAQQEEDPERKRHYLIWAKRMYDWVEATLRSPDGLYWDHIDADGRIDESIYTYNQGAMMTASLLLADATGDDRYSTRAVEIGDAIIQRWDAAGMMVQPVAFNAILIEDLLRLNDHQPNQAYLDLIADYADRFWSAHRNPDTNLVTTSNPTTLLDQSGAIRVYALLAGYSS